MSLLVEGRVVDLGGVWCRRAKCASCEVSWTLRPPGLAPRRQFQLCVVARAASRYLFDRQASLSTTAADHGCATRTLGRWLAWIAGLASPSALERRLVSTLDAPLLVPLRDVAGLALKARTPARRRRLTRAAHVLVLLEALARATGAAPPGLRGVLERVVAGRDRVTTEARPRVPELAARQAGRGLGTIPM